MPNAPDTESPGRIDGAVLVYYHLDIPGAAEQVNPLTCGLFGRMRDGDTSNGAGVAVGESAKIDECILCNYRLDYLCKWKSMYIVITAAQTSEKVMWDESG